MIRQFFIIVLGVFLCPKITSGCEFHDQRTISFQSNDSKDMLSINFTSEDHNCIAPNLEVTIRSSSGETILRKSVYISSTMFHEDFSYEGRLQNAQDLFNSHVDMSILDTGELPDRVICEKSKAECAYEEFPNEGEEYSDMAYSSDLGFQEYLSLKQKGIPMIILETDIELWEAFVYDDRKKRALSVLSYAP